ncbi:MAG TPA: GvpL/GvpF family gas vesicle protein [Pyrinomonadaceae bacterium]|jgi:hypothetical protein
MTLYAYCLSDELADSMLEDVAGVSGTGLRLLESGGIRVAVSEFEGERVEVGRENVFAHERVVQHVLRQITPLPFRFGTLVTMAGLEEFLKANRARLIKSLEHVRGSVEMSVKIIWDAESIRRLALGAEGSGNRKQDETTLQGRGAAYLAAKRQQILGEEQLKERAAEVADWLTQEVGGAACDRDVQVRPSDSLVVRAAYLVRREWLADYRQRLEEARAARPDLRFLTSGPWPPYSFSSINP